MAEGVDVDVYSQVEGDIELDRLNFVSVDQIDPLLPNNNKNVFMNTLFPHKLPPHYHETFLASSCCSCVCFIIITILSIINIQNMEHWEYKPGIAWSVIVFIFCIIFILINITLNIYMCWKERFISIRGCSVCCGISAVFIIAALVISFYLISKNSEFERAEEAEGECFSADSFVYIKKQNDTQKIHKMLIRDIEIGDYVLTLDPITDDVYWDEILVRVHYEWYDRNNTYNSMRTLHLDNNITSITLTDDHFIFINDNITNKPKLTASKYVQIGDILFYYDHNTKSKLLNKVTKIEENVLKQKRVFFTMSEYVLVNDIVASPFIGPHPIVHTILHKLFTSNMVLIRYIWPHYMMSKFSSIAIILIYSIWFIIMHFLEFCVGSFGIYLVYNVWIVAVHVNTKRK